MTIQLVVSAENTLIAIKRALGEFFDVDANDVEALSRRSLWVRLDEISRIIRAELIMDHPLAGIVDGALDDLRDHAKAIELLGESRATLVHARHIEEVAAVLQYLISKSDRYAEFRWRWDNFKTAHAIRNRILNLKKPLEPSMQKWIDNNLSNLKKVTSKFTGASVKDGDAWEKYSSWLVPINLKEIFAATNRKASYASQLYDWNSQDVHFSPIGGVHMGYELAHQTGFEFVVETAERELDGLCRILLPMLINTDRVRDFHARLILLDTFRLVTSRPAQFNELTQKSERYAQILAELIRPEQVKERLSLVLLGGVPKDPLVIG